MVITTMTVTNKQKQQAKWHKDWVKDNREIVKVHDTKYRNSPKGLATRKRWDEKNREARREYHRTWVKKTTKSD